MIHLASVSGLFRFGGTGMRRVLLVFMMAATMAFFGWPSAAAAQEQVDTLPAVTNFTSARFDILTTTQLGGETFNSFGKGAVILPDRVNVTVGADSTNQRVSVVQIGNTTYTNDGSGWRRTEGAPFGGNPNALLSDQIKQLSDLANGIVRVGDEPVRGVSTTHYQVWLSGDRVLAALGDTSELFGGANGSEVRSLIEQSTFKIDLWIGQDGRLHQQQTIVTVPETTISDTPIPAFEVSILVSYYDFNDPSISIQAPI